MEHKTHIQLTPFEIQSGLDRQRGAESLIVLINPEHEGRNTWLLNYGTGQEAQRIRREHKGSELLSWNEKTNSLNCVNGNALEASKDADAMTVENITREGWAPIKKQEGAEDDPAHGFEKGNLFMVFNPQTKVVNFILRDPSKVELPVVVPERFSVYFLCDSIFKLRMFTQLVNQ